MLTDPLELARQLIACASVTPADEGVQAVLAAALENNGFTVTRLRFGEIENFYAERGDAGKLLCFAGHTDVVPPGPGWRHGPFAAEIIGNVLYGRGAVDMKGAIAAFAAAAAVPCKGRLALLITGDEEGEAVNGTARVLEWMQAQNKIPDLCIVGEPTSQVRLGDTIKIGRRGSLNARITVHGKQGHVAYPQAADNPVHRLVAVLETLMARKLDLGTQWFEPSTLQITSIDVGNPASNVIPASAQARLNIRFNDAHDEAGLSDWLTETLARFAPMADLQIDCTGDAFLTIPGLATQMLATAIERVTGHTPKYDTGGGTSDARFISKFCPVAEFGLVGSSMHQADECVNVTELRQLAAIYRAMIEDFCG